MKQKPLTQSLSWLHTWDGLVFGWILFSIFLTGTLAAFDKEIDGWMRPEIPAHSLDKAQSAHWITCSASTPMPAPGISAFTLSVHRA